MDVVLPEPLGPSRPKISPGGDAQVKVVKRDKIVITLDEVFDVDDVCHEAAPFCWSWPGTIASSQEPPARTSELCHECEAWPRGLPTSPICRVGGMSRLRRQPLHRARLRVQYPYEQAFRQIDRAGVLYCGRHGSCCGRSPGRGVCLGVIATSLAEVVQGNRARRVSEAASYACIIAAVFRAAVCAVCASRSL